MDSDAEVIQFFEIQAEFSGSHRGTDDSSGESGPEGNSESQQLQQALTRNMPMIRRQVHSALQSEWSLHDYLERLYKRLRNRLSASADLDQAIDAGIKSLLHEDARNRARRSIRLQSLDAQQSEPIDPYGLHFVTTLAVQDKLRKFIELLDPWTRTAFYAVHIDGEGVPRAVVAQRMGMKENSFNKRFQRRMEKAKDQYVKAYGRP
jgi:DNA-directed RNA polymerase specialized sigma24 family protein